MKVPTIKDIDERKKNFLQKITRDDIFFGRYRTNLSGYYHTERPCDIPDTWLAKWLYIFDLTCTEFSVYSGLRVQTIKDLRSGRLFLKESLKQEFMRIYFDLYRGRVPAPCKKHAERSGKIVRERIQMIKILNKDNRRWVYPSGFDFDIYEKFYAIEKELSLTW